jgi:hypothetical protein
MKDLPEEVWVIRLKNGHLVPPQDDDGTNVFMAWPSREEAMKGLAYQRQYLEANDRPQVVRLLPRTALFEIGSEYA